MSRNRPRGAIVTTTAIALITALTGCANPTRHDAGYYVDREDRPVATPQPKPTSHDESDLAKKLANPVASLISVPLQYNFDRGIGANDRGRQHRLNIQPVIPLEVSDEWNLISRTIVPVVSNHNEPEDETGLGDVLQSAFLSPAEPGPGGWIWGVGPAVLFPTATDETLGSERWGLGPTGVALRQSGHWTYGALANHLWDVGGDSDRDRINATFVQPFVIYTFPSATGIGVNSESTYDWRSDRWSIPINVFVNQVVHIGNQPIQLTAGVRYWADAPRNGPEGFGFRIVMTLLFPH